MDKVAELLSNPSQRGDVDGAAHQQGCTNDCSKEGLITSSIQTPSAFDSDWAGPGFMIHGSSREVAEGVSCLSVRGPFADYVVVCFTRL